MSTNGKLSPDMDYKHFQFTVLNGPAESRSCANYAYVVCERFRTKKILPGEAAITCTLAHPLYADASNCKSFLTFAIQFTSRAINNLSFMTILYYHARYLLFYMMLSN